MKEKVKSNVAITYLHECVEVLRQVTWPTNNQAIRYTVITFAFCAVFGAFLTVSDFVFKWVYDFLILS